MATLFISDLHLADGRADITAAFLDFLKTQARTAEALYILGDLFEYWIGDEALDLGDHPRIIAALKALSAHGVPLYVMVGNRDFMIGPHFAKATGCKLLPDPSLINLYGTPTLLTHGDDLCTDDHAHMQFRAMVRDPAWQAMVLQKSVAEREAMAREYRAMSDSGNAIKDEAIMDVNQDAVVQAMNTHKVAHMIHGHTHRPAVHQLMSAQGPSRRIVLGDWYTQGSVLECDDSGCALKSLGAHQHVARA